MFKSLQKVQLLLGCLPIMNRFRLDSENFLPEEPPALHCSSLGACAPHRAAPALLSSKVYIQRSITNQQQQQLQRGAQAVTLAPQRRRRALAMLIPCVPVQFSAVLQLVSAGALPRAYTLAEFSKRWMLWLCYSPLCAVYCGLSSNSRPKNWRLCTTYQYILYPCRRRVRRGRQFACLKSEVKSITKFGRVLIDLGDSHFSGQG